jgi:hypothetical protein
LRVVADDYEMDGSFTVGDYVWVYDPDAGLYDTSSEVTFRGQRINPIKLRVVETSWPITGQMTVAYRHQDGSWINLSNYFAPESGSTTIGVGELSRSLTNAGTEPVGPRPIPDSTIPGQVEWDLPFTTGVYLDALGGSRARILVNWLLPLNADGSTILDGSHYEIRYGVSPATTWQTEFAPWGDLQAQILDLSPGVDYDFQIRAVDLAGNQGEWSATETATANPDTIPPSTPAPPTVAGSQLAIQIAHTLGKASGGTFNLELDLSHLEVHVGSVGSFTPDDTTLKGQVAANAGMIAAEIPAVGTVDVAETTIRYVKVIAVDQAGNKSSPSTAATATAVLIDSAHISDLTVTKVTAGTISANWLIGASIRTASSGQRVELNATGLHGYNSGGTELVSLLNTGSFTLRSATTGARVDLSNTSGLQLYNSLGTRTVHLDTDGSFELRSAASGARIQLDGDGFAAYNSSSQQTVDIDAATGSVTMVGTVSTGFSGKRIVFNPSGATQPVIRFMPAVGSSYARLEATVDNTTDYIGMLLQSSTWSNSRADLEVYPGLVRAQAWNNFSGNALGGYFELGVGGVSLYRRTAGGGLHGIHIDDTDVYIMGSPYKSFIIDHPTDADRWLVHACTESPHAGVEYWGDTVLDDQGRAVVKLPEYFEALTLKTGRAVSVNTCSDVIRNASATYPTDGEFTIHGGPGLHVTWIVKAIRADAGDMLVEPRRDQIDVHGTAPYLSYTLKESREQPAA